MTLLAHTGHWSGYLVYLAPVLAAGAWLGVERLRGRRGGRAEKPRP